MDNIPQLRLKHLLLVEQEEQIRALMGRQWESPNLVPMTA